MTENEFILILRAELEPIKQDIRETKNDLHDLQLEFQNFQLNYQSFQQEFQSLKLDFQGLKMDFQSFQQVFQDLKQDFQNFRTYTENEIEGKIILLAENYVPAARRYERTAPEISEMKRDIDVLKTIVMKHSTMLEKIS